MQLQNETIVFQITPAWLDIAKQCPCLHFAFFSKFSPLVIHFEKIWVLLPPQMWHFPSLTFRILFVLRFFFSYSIVSSSLDLCLPPAQKSLLNPFCHQKNHIGQEHSHFNFNFFFVGWKKICFYTNLYIHLILVENFFFWLFVLMKFLLFLKQYELHLQFWTECFS